MNFPLQDSLKSNFVEALASREGSKVALKCLWMNFRQIAPSSEKDWFENGFLKVRLDKKICLIYKMNNFLKVSELVQIIMLTGFIW